MANYEETGIGYDLTFELNEFHEPRIRSELETIRNVVLFVLFSKPGQYPSLPNIGMNIESLLYSHYEDLEEDDIQNEIIEQCSELGTYISNGTLSVLLTEWEDKPALAINIEGSETFPPGYKHDKLGYVDRYLIGITYDEMNKMIYQINGENV